MKLLSAALPIDLLVPNAGRKKRKKEKRVRLLASI